MRNVVKCNIILSIIFWGCTILLLPTATSNAQTGVTNVQINASALDASNNLIITGFIVLNNSIVSGVARYTSAGALDTSFGLGGFTVSSVGSRIESNAIVIQADGKI